MGTVSGWVAAAHGQTFPVKRDRGNTQLKRLGSKPGDDLPILTLCRRIRLTSSGSSMSAMTFMSAPHLKHTNGSTS